MPHAYGSMPTALFTCRVLYIDESGSSRNATAALCANASIYAPSDYAIFIYNIELSWSFF